jgi:hypothetical protein
MAHLVDCQGPKTSSGKLCPGTPPIRFSGACEQHLLAETEGFIHNVVVWAARLRDAKSGSEQARYLAAACHGSCSHRDLHNEHDSSSATPPSSELVSSNNSSSVHLRDVGP